MPVPVPATRSFTDLPVLLAAALTAIIVLAALGGPARRRAGSRDPRVRRAAHPRRQRPRIGVVLAACYALAALAFLLAGAGSGVTRRRGVAATAPGRCWRSPAVAVLTVAAVNPGPPYDPRDALRLPLDIRVSQDPLALLSALLETPRTPVLTARLSGALLSHPRNWVVLTYTDTRRRLAGRGRRQACARGGQARARRTGAVATGTGRAVVTAAARVALLPHPADVLRHHARGPRLRLRRGVARLAPGHQPVHGHGIGGGAQRPAS